VNTAWLLEAAIRTLIMAAITLTALKVLRIDHIRTRRTAWLMALGAALLMPLLVAAHIGPRILPEFSRPEPARFSAESGLAAAATPSAPIYQITTGASTTQQSGIEAVEVVSSRPPLKQLIARAALGIYVVVAALLLLRLIVGVGIALRLKWRAQRIDMQSVPKADVRVSAQLMNPVTVTSSILLPRNYLQWDAATLRIVLSHEFAHVRQKDFYVQLLAGLHSALFWFNPFSWWLQRQLADLGEALSDHAASQQADSRASYAEVLLRFATGGNPPLAAVAMARTSNLAPRIERLLNERGFERSFTARPRLPIVAAAVVTLALLASTSVKRVDAAASESIVTPPPAEAPQPPEIAPWPEAPPAPEAPTPPQAAKPTPAKPARPTPPLIASAPVVRVASIAPVAPIAPIAPIAAAPMVPAMPLTLPMPAVAPVPAVEAVPAMPSPRAAGALRVAMASPGSRESSQDHALETWADIDDDGIAYMDINNDEVFVFKSGSARMMFNGDFKKRFGRDMPTPEGDFIFYQHHGKPYLVQDPAILAKALELYAPLRDKHLTDGRQSAEFARMQANLEMQRRSLKKMPTDAKLSSAEFQSSMDELSKMVEQMKNDKLSPQSDPKTLIELQNRLGSIQGRLGQLQAQLAMQASGLSMQDEMLAGQQAQLAAEQAQREAEHERYGGATQKIINDAQRQLKPLIEQGIRDGRVKSID
jgi:beta-lactamase regulating signal transducer with metallopeptidase domain